MNATAAMATGPPVPICVRIAVVGDVQYDWDPVRDQAALKLLKADLVLFTGNFGEENVELVKSISKLDLPKCVILGNHDCWWSAGPCRSRLMCGGDSTQGSENITAQLRALGPYHVGYSRLDFAKLQISVVGGRPFSSGGTKFNPAGLLSKRYGVKNMRQSELRITESALGAPVENSLVFLASIGPFGLKSKEVDIAEERWVRKKGKQCDQGDPDLAAAIETAQLVGKRKVPLVVFGHMHTNLGNFGARIIMVDGTVHLYGARSRRCRKVVGIRPILLSVVLRTNEPDVVEGATDDEQGAIEEQKNALKKPPAQKNEKKAPDAQKKAPDAQKRATDVQKKPPGPQKKGQKNAKDAQSEAEEAAAAAAEAEKKALEEVKLREQQEADAAALMYEVTDRQFTIVEFQKGQLKTISEVWVRDGHPLKDEDQCRIVGVKLIFTGP